MRFRLLIVAATATTLVGCGEERRDCVDANGNRLPENYCRSSGYYPGARWIYGGSVNGNRVTTGSTTPSERGGFGGSGGSGG